MRANTPLLWSTWLKCAAATTAACLAAAAHAEGPTSFTASAKGAIEAHFPYMPIKLELKTVKPAGIVKEPAYKGTPLYAVIHLGNGPKADTIVAFDQPTSGDWKVYVDANQDGDLTNDGDGSWAGKKEGNGRTMYGLSYFTLHASYGTKTHETSGGPYTIGLYTFSNMGPFMFRATSRTGTVEVDGKPHAAVVVENDTDGIFNKTVRTAAEAAKSRPVWMKIDLDDDGKYASGLLDVRAPFKLGDKTYEVKMSPDGSQIAMNTTTKVALDLTPKQPERPPLLKAGTPAPEFVAEKWGGGDLKLSDYRGKVVVLDFWATWCGPCQMSMPHVESVNKGVQGQDVAVIGVCVWDDKAAYKDWMPKNQSKYTFQFAFDPAGKSTANSIAAKLFHVSGIPTTYVIDKDGNVADAIVGYEEGDKRLEEALKKLGVTVQAPASK